MGSSCSYKSAISSSHVEQINSSTREFTDDKTGNPSSLVPSLQSGQLTPSSNIDFSHQQFLKQPRLRHIPKYKNVDEEEPLPVSTIDSTSAVLQSNKCTSKSENSPTIYNPNQPPSIETTPSQSPPLIDPNDLKPSAIVQRRRRSQQFSIDEGGCLKSPSHGGLLPSPMAGLDPIYPLTEEREGDSNSNHLLSPNVSRQRSLLTNQRRSSSQSSSNRPPLMKMTPKFMYNSSVDRESRRPIVPSLPYSPQMSPCHSPLHRVKRQPTRESRSVSIVEDEDGYMQLNQYRIRRDLGKGSYGLVKLAYNDNDSNHYALKMLSKKKMMRTAGLLRRLPPRRKHSAAGPESVGDGCSTPVSPSQNPLHRVYQEIAIQKKLDHPNIVKLVEVLDDPEQDCIYSVFELVSRGSVMDVYGNEPIPEDLARSYFRDTLLGLEYLHYQKVVHRDIKPSNLLLTDDGHIKICDFGVSNQFSGEDVYLSNTAGSPAFMAPESVSETQAKLFGGKGLDIWALGVTLYCFIYAKVPFDQARIVDLYHSIVHDPVLYPDQQTVSDELKDMLDKMLEKDPLNRIGISQLREHPWVTQHGKSPLISTQENCQEFVEVTDFDVNNCIRFVAKLETLIKVKLILHRRSFRNPLSKSDHSQESSCSGCLNCSTDSSNASQTSAVSTPLNQSLLHPQPSGGSSWSQNRSNSAPEYYEELERFPEDIPSSTMLPDAAS